MGTVNDIYSTSSVYSLKQKEIVVNVMLHKVSKSKARLRDMVSVVA